EAREALAPQLCVEEVLTWAAHPLFLDALAEKSERGLARFAGPERAEVQWIFSAHSLPERILRDNDPYPRELHQTVAGLVQRLGNIQHQFAYQSAGSTHEPWLGPDV